MEHESLIDLEKKWHRTLGLGDFYFVQPDKKLQCWIINNTEIVRGLTDKERQIHSSFQNLKNAGL